MLDLQQKRAGYKNPGWKGFQSGLFLDFSPFTVPPGADPALFSDVFLGGDFDGRCNFAWGVGSRTEISLVPRPTTKLRPRMRVSNPLGTARSVKSVGIQSKATSLTRTYLQRSRLFVLIGFVLLFFTGAEPSARGQFRAGAPANLRSTRSPVESGDPARSIRPQTDIESGYLFVEGRYLPPPYTVDWNGEAVTINGRPMRLPFRRSASTEQRDICFGRRA